MHFMLMLLEQPETSHPEYVEDVTAPRPNEGEAMVTLIKYSMHFYVDASRTTRDK